MVGVVTGMVVVGTVEVGVELGAVVEVCEAGPWVDAVISAVIAWPGGLGTVALTGTKAMVMS